MLDVPVIGVAKNGWDLDQFRDYAVASLKQGGIDPRSPAAAKMLGLLPRPDKVTGARCRRMCGLGVRAARSAHPGRVTHGGPITRRV